MDGKEIDATSSLSHQHQIFHLWQIVGDIVT